MATTLDLLKRKTLDVLDEGDLTRNALAARLGMDPSCPSLKRALAQLQYDTFEITERHGKYSTRLVSQRGVALCR